MASGEAGLELNYPTDRMTAIAGEIRTQIATALQTHQSVLVAIAGSADQLPSGTGQLFLNHLTAWDENVNNAYAALRQLSSLLEHASSLMIETDQSTAQSFGG
jgi:uncharacterized protein YukE